MKSRWKLLGINLISATILSGSTLVLTGCSTQLAPQARDTPHGYCQQLQQQMARDEANTQPGVNSSPTNQAMLLQRYRTYDCPSLLDPATSNSAKQTLTAPPKVDKHRN